MINRSNDNIRMVHEQMTNQSENKKYYDKKAINTTVLFTWKVDNRLKQFIKENLIDHPEVNLIFPELVTDDILLKYAPEIDIMVGWRVNDNIKLNAKQMKLFINPGVGIKHHIDFFRKLNRSRKVLLINGHGNSYFTAQHVVAMLLALMNKIIPHHNWMVEGLWRKGDKDASSIPLRYRKIGFLGYGAINKKVHRFLSGFKVEFSVLRRHWPTNDIDMPTPVKKYLPEDLSQFLDEVDILIIAIPETSHTINLLNYEELKRLGSDGLIVNVSRGSIINEEGLYNILKERKIAGAAIDVWYEYNPDFDNNGLKYPYHLPFHELDNIVFSPHRAASPFDDLERWYEVIENIKRYNQARTDFLNVVDLQREY